MFRRPIGVRYPVRARKFLYFQYDSDCKIWASSGAIAGRAHPVQSGDFRRRCRLLTRAAQKGGERPLAHARGSVGGARVSDEVFTRLFARSHHSVNAVPRLRFHTDSYSKRLCLEVSRWGAGFLRPRRSSHSLGAVKTL